MIEELFENGILNRSDYTNSSPVVPIQQIPEAEDNVSWTAAGLPEDAPFIVYDTVITGSYEDSFWNCRDEIVLWIYDYDISKLFEIKEFLYDLFHRLDLAALDINNFDDGDNTFRFHYFDVMTGLPSDEIDQVVGRYGMNMVISYQYNRQIQSNGRFA